MIHVEGGRRRLRKRLFTSVLLKVLIGRFHTGVPKGKVRRWLVYPLVCSKVNSYSSLFKKELF